MVEIELKIKTKMAFNELCIKIQRNFTTISKEIDLKDLLNNVYETGFMCFYDFNTLMSKSCVERNYDFLLNLQMYGERVGLAFIIWLGEMYPKLDDLLEKTIIQRESDTELNYEKATKDQDYIRKQYVLLLRRVNPNAIAPQLYEDGFFDRDDLESIFIKNTRQERASKLMSKITGRLKTSYIRAGVFESFTKALKSFQPDLHREFLSKVRDT